MRETGMEQHDRQMMMMIMMTPITHIQYENDNTLNEVNLFDLIPTLDTEAEE
jgi:hypothetical protein